MLQERVDELALPLALDELVLDEVGLLPHPEPLEDARGGVVARLQAAGDAVQAKLVERQCEDHASRLGRIPAAVVVGMEEEADLTLAVLRAHEEEAGVADQLRG